jgi:hypothetical protein
MTSTLDGPVAGPSSALHELHRAVLALPDPAALGTWRWAVRQRMAGVRDLLLGEADHPDDGWLAPRRGVALRERNSLLMRLNALGPLVLEGAEVEHVRTELLRLLADINHHLQRLRDLAWDEVEAEVGGSE